VVGCTGAREGTTCNLTRSYELGLARLKPLHYEELFTNRALDGLAQCIIRDLQGLRAVRAARRQERHNQISAHG
jgi:hypothetical protein